MSLQCANKTVAHSRRSRIVMLWVAGLTTREVSEQTGASVSTVHRWVRRWQDTGTVRAKPISGRPTIGVRKMYKLPAVSRIKPQYQDSTLPYPGTRFRFNLQVAGKCQQCLEANMKLYFYSQLFTEFQKNNMEHLPGGVQPGNFLLQSARWCTFWLTRQLGYEDQHLITPVSILIKQLQIHWRK